MADALVDWATEDWNAPSHPVVLDPTCGAGSFLLAAGRWLERGGLDRATIVERCLWGSDTDAEAVSTARDVLAHWAAATGRRPRDVHVLEADALGPWPPRPDWPDVVDLAVGNPPFLSQLSRRTARSRDQQQALRDELGPLAATYTDTAVLVAVRAVRRLRTGGRSMFILPQSFLGARDTRAARDALVEGGTLVGLWSAEDPGFDVSVQVCAPVIEAGPAQPRPVRIGRGARCLPAGDCPPPTGSSWSGLLAAGTGVPPVPALAGAGFDTLATTTAGFRDEYYGIVGCVDDGEPSPDRLRLVTSGTIDPCRDHWGVRPARFARQRFAAPVVDLDGVVRNAPRVAAWGRRLAVPKVLIATQTKVVEAVADPGGTAWASTPVIAAVPRPGAPADALARLLAVLCAPAISARALIETAGTALARDALKLSARQLAALPLPTETDAWNRAAALLDPGELAALDDAAVASRLWDVGLAMNTAYRIDGVLAGDLHAWWWSRLPGGISHIDP